MRDFVEKIKTAIDSWTEEDFDGVDEARFFSDDSLFDGLVFQYGSLDSVLQEESINELLIKSNVVTIGEIIGYLYQAEKLDELCAIFDQEAKTRLIEIERLSEKLVVPAYLGALERTYHPKGDPTSPYDVGGGRWCSSSDYY